MPILKQIYNDVINTVGKEPKKIGSHFWLAVTAYRMMQEDNNDSMDYSYADVGTKHIAYQSDPVFRKAMKAYGEKQSLERMKDAGSFWKIYDALEADPERETVEDIRNKELEIYDGKIDKLNGKLKEFNQQYIDYLEQMKALPMNTPE